MKILIYKKGIVMKSIIMYCCITLICPSVFIVLGIIMKKHPPKKINDLYGYRTVRSMKSQAAWDFAQVLSGKEVIKIGIVDFVLTFVLIPFIITKNLQVITTLSIIMLVIQVVSIFFVIVGVEKSLKENFPDE